MLLAQRAAFRYFTNCHTLRERLCRRGDIVGKLVSKEVIVGNQMRVAGESLTLSSARREYGLVAGDQSAARLARVIIGHVGGDVHTETVARELVVHSLPLVRELAVRLNAARLRTVFLVWWMVWPLCSL